MREAVTVLVPWSDRELEHKLTDAIASDWYRRRMTGVWVRRALDELAASMRGREA